MPTEAEACIERLDYLRNEVKKELRDMTPEALNWRPTPADTNSPYAIANHIAGIEAQWIHQFVGGLEIQRSREAEFAAKGNSVADLNAMLDRAGDTTRRVLRTLSAEDLAKTKSPAPGREQLSYRWVVLHTIEHMGQHLGHLSLTRQLYHSQARRR